MKLFDGLNRRQRTAWLIAGAVVLLAVVAGVALMLRSNRQVVLNADVVGQIPEPEAAVPLAPIGDSRADRVRSVVIYHPDAIGLNLVTDVREVTYGSDLTLEEAVVEAVLDELGADADDIQLLSLEVSQRVATVNLSIDARMLDPEQLHSLRAALVNSLLELSDMDYVNVLINDREECIIQLPTGTLNRFGTELDAEWTQAASEQARFDSDESAVLERYMTLYFGAAGGEYILPEVRSARIEGDDYLGAVVEQLLRGPDDTLTYSRLMPSDSEYLRRTPAIVVSDDGNRIAVLSFNGKIMEYFERNGISTALAMGALTRSICGFVPEVDGVLCDINGITLTELTDINGEVVYAFDDGIMRRSDFDSLVGEVARVYYPSGEPAVLKPYDIAVSRYDVDNPRALLKLLMEAPEDGGARRAMPQGVTDADVLGVRVDSDQVLINLSGAFYQACQGMSADEARALVYSIVNTMCELPGIKSVRFYFDGERVDYLAGAICLRGPLMSNVGIVRS